MTNSAFDTLKYWQKLKAAGMPEQQATALTEAQNEAFMESADRMMATKSDLLELKQEVKQEIKQAIASFRVEVKQEIADLRTEIKQDVANLRTEVKHDIAELKTEFNIKFVRVESHLKLHNWMIGFVLTGIGALILKTFFA